MHRSEADDRNRCLQCGAEVAIARDRSFAIGSEDVLCFACAISRGGSYDERLDRWERSPRLDGLPQPESFAQGRPWR